MGDGIEEAVLLLISPDLSDQEDGVDHESRNEQSEKDDAKYEWYDLTPVENDPTDIEYDCQGDETNPQHNKEHDRFGAARDAHDVLVYASAESAPPQAGKQRRLVASLIPRQSHGCGSVAAGYRLWSGRLGHLSGDRGVSLSRMPMLRKFVPLDVFR